MKDEPHDKMQGFLVFLSEVEVSLSFSRFLSE